MSTFIWSIHSKIIIWSTTASDLPKQRHLHFQKLQFIHVCKKTRQRIDVLIRLHYLIPKGAKQMLRKIIITKCSLKQFSTNILLTGGLPCNYQDHQKGIKNKGIGTRAFVIYHLSTVYTYQLERYCYSHIVNKKGPAERYVLNKHSCQYNCSISIAKKLGKL